MEIKRNAIALPHIGRAIATTFLFIFILCTTCFASDWNFDFEKELYMKNAEVFLNTHPTGNTDMPTTFFTENFCNNLFDLLETYMENNTSINQSSYPYLILRFNHEYGIRAWFSSNINSIGNTANSFIYIDGSIRAYTINISNNNISSISAYPYSSSSANFIISSTYPTAFFISDNLIYNSNITYVPTYAKNSYYGKTYSSTSIGKFNPATLGNNFILNKEIQIGNNYNYSINYYYIQNNEKVYITDYVTVSETTSWWGRTLQPYIQSIYMDLIPNNKYFYYDLTITGKTPITLTYHIDNELAFITSSNINTPEEIPPEDVPPEDNGGGGDSGGSNVDLSTIENGIDNLNTTTENISATTTEISNKIDNIETSITEVPTETIENTEITADDLTEAVGVEFESDPYQNMWTTITNGLSNALTGTNRTLTTSFRNTSYTIDLDDFSIQIPQALKPFLQIITTVFLSWKMFKYIKEIIDKISSGNIDKVLEMNEEEGIVDLF